MDETAEQKILEMIEQSRPFLHWGDWIKRRAAWVGYKNQAEVAKAVGCTRSQLYRWFGMEWPPEQIRKRFDAGLAAALKVDRELLFSRWRLVGPEDAPVVPAPGRDWLEERQRAINSMVRGLLILSDEGFARVRAFLRSEIDKVAKEVEQRMRSEDETSLPKRPVRKSKPRLR
jgi:hypothetical protein